VSKLLSDRTHLLATQQAATLQALAVHDRLNRIETQIQQQQQAYEQRIDALTRELLAAKEENRQLIRAQIDQVKAEMEATRSRIRASAPDRAPAA
jgi:archaellum component FlaC